MYLRTCIFAKLWKAKSFCVCAHAKHKILITGICHFPRVIFLHPEYIFILNNLVKVYTVGQERDDEGVVLVKGSRGGHGWQCTACAWCLYSGLDSRCDSQMLAPWLFSLFIYGLWLPGSGSVAPWLGYAEWVEYVYGCQWHWHRYLSISYYPIKRILTQQNI